MTLDDVPRVPRKKRSRKKRRSRKTRRIIKAIGWSLLAIVTTAIFVTGAVMLALGLRVDAN